jgi:hypothetical protein
MKPQPRKGRYFPISVADGVALTKKWKLEGLSTKGGVLFENPDKHSRGRNPLVKLRTQIPITIYSLSDDVNDNYGYFVTSKAISLCAVLNHKRFQISHQAVRLFMVYLIDLETLSLVEERIYFRQPKFRNQLSDLKPHVWKREEVGLREIKLDSAQQS